MVLGIEELHRLVKENNLVEGLSKRELENPEGAGFDLRIGGEKRETPEVKLIAEYKEGETKTVALQPHTYYLMRTVEKVNLPESLLAIMTPRSTLFRSGIYIFGGQVAPGYSGELYLGIYNFRDAKFEMEMGSRVLHIMFFEVKGKGNMYRGQWQGGRVATNERETQV